MIVLVGGDIGACWTFTAQRVMTGARRGEEEIAAASVVTVNQTGLALGAAVAGFVANVAGFVAGGDTRETARAAFTTSASDQARALGA